MAVTRTAIRACYREAEASLAIGGCRVSHEYRDEFVSANGKHPHTLGDEAACFIVQTMHEQFPRHRTFMPDHLRTVDECVNAFYERRAGDLERFLDGYGPDEDSDEPFEHRVRFLVSRWFLNVFAGTESGHVRDAVRKRLSRGAQRGLFTRHRDKRWGLKDGPSSPSKVRESALAAAAEDCDMDAPPAAFRDDAQKIHFGRRGQLETLLRVVFEKADGTLDLGTITRIVLGRCGFIERKPDVVSLEGLRERRSWWEAGDQVSGDFTEAVLDGEIADDPDHLDRKRILAVAASICRHNPECYKQIQEVLEEPLSPERIAALKAIIDRMNHVTESPSESTPVAVKSDVTKRVRPSRKSGPNQLALSAQLKPGPPMKRDSDKGSAGDRGHRKGER